MNYISDLRVHLMIIVQTNIVEMVCRMWNGWIVATFFFFFEVYLKLEVEFDYKRIVNLIAKGCSTKHIL